jgi:hypothetical protein
VEDFNDSAILMALREVIYIRGSDDDYPDNFIQGAGWKLRTEILNK